MMTKSLMAHAMTGISAATLCFSAAFPAWSADPAGVKNIVLVHGAWADGSGWRGVYDILTKDGYNVSVVQNPLTTMADDVAATDRVLARQDGPTILVGHSYGGAVITEAGDDPKVVGLVYIAAFAPDVGESAFGLLPQDGPQPPIEPSADGYGFFNNDAYTHAFAPDVGPELGAFMADSQVPPAFAAGMAPMTMAAWKSKPSWYLVSTDDQIIPPEGQKMMAARAGSTVAEVAGSHVAFISHPEAAAALIEQAAQSITE
jgi:pimeloyl-ACP methyl ester carboxylesterase